MSIEIIQEALCSFCESNFDENRDRCEGRKCDQARILYIEDHGLEEVTPCTFG